MGKLRRNLETYRLRLAEYGITNPVHLDAILANILVESGGNPNAKNSKSTARGLLQWTKARYPKAWDEDTLLRYIADTYNHFGGNDWQNKAAYNRFMNTTDPVEAARLFRRYYERPEAHTYNWTDRYFEGNGGLSNSGLLDWDLLLRALEDLINNPYSDFVPSNPEVFNKVINGDYDFLELLGDVGNVGSVGNVGEIWKVDEKDYLKPTSMSALDRMMTLLEMMNDEESSTVLPITGNNAPFVARIVGLGGKINLFDDGGDKKNNLTFVRDINNNPVAFDAEGNLVDLITREEGRLSTPEVVITPNGKPAGYQYSSAFDGSLGNFMEVTNALTGGMANRLSPTQNARFLYDVANGKDYVSSWMGNNGIVTDKFALEHPYLSMAANMAGDAVLPTTWLGLSKMPKRVAPKNVEGVAFTSKGLPTLSEDVVEELPITFRRDAAERMKSFLHSEDYEERLKRAALATGKRVEDLDTRDIMERRISDKDYFPAFMKDRIGNDDTTLGISKIHINKNTPDIPIGVTIKKDVVPTDEFIPTIDHEVAHYSSINVDPKNDLYETTVRNDVFGLATEDETNRLMDMMNYNRLIAPKMGDTEFYLRLGTSSPEEVASIKKYIDKAKLKEDLETRSRAYEVVLEAVLEGRTPENFVDLFVKDGQIIPTAPSGLYDLSLIYSVPNLKKYIKNFLTTTGAVYTGAKLNEKE